MNLKIRRSTVGSDIMHELNIHEAHYDGYSRSFKDVESNKMSHSDVVTSQLNQESPLELN